MRAYTALRSKQYRRIAPLTSIHIIARMSIHIIARMSIHVSGASIILR